MELVMRNWFKSNSHQNITGFDVWKITLWQGNLIRWFGSGNWIRKSCPGDFHTVFPKNVWLLIFINRVLSWFTKQNNNKSSEFKSQKSACGFCVFFKTEKRIIKRKGHTQKIAENLKKKNLKKLNIFYLKLSVIHFKFTKYFFQIYSHIFYMY